MRKASTNGWLHNAMLPAKVIAAVAARVLTA